MQNPDDSKSNRKRLEREFKDALKTGGIDIAPQRLLDELVDVAVAECIELRDRIANKILAPVIGRYEVPAGGSGCTERQLEMLHSTILFHFEDDDGNIQLPKEVTDPWE